jgi:hypothetical protein
MIALIFTLLILAGLGYLLLSPRLKGWRTQLFATVLTTVGGLIPLANEVFGYLYVVDWRTYLSKDYLPFVVVGIGTMVAILRYLTSTPVGKKE